MPVKRTYNLDSGAVDILDRAVEDALTLGGKILADRMQELSPLLTGRMERSVQVGEVQKTADGFRVMVGPTVEYARYTELEPYIIGKIPGIKSQIKGATIPWMRPAVDDKREEIIAFVQNAVRLTVRSLAARFHPPA